MAAIVKITPSLFDDLYRCQLRDWNPHISETRWRRAFQCWANHPEDHCGYAMTDGQRIVGVVGMMFSERRIHGRPARLCNVHSWRVDPEYRAKSLLLMRPLASMRDHTITDLTSGRQVVSIMKRFGLETLDRSATILPPVPGSRRDRGLTIVDLAGPAEQYEKQLSPDDLAIYRDHRDLDCGHVLAQTQHGYCYLVYSTIEQRWTRHCMLHYVSDPRLFAAHHAAIRGHLMRASRARWVAIDSRLLAGASVPYSLQVPAIEKLYRSNQLAPHEIDSLYTEQAVLKHTSLYPLRHQFRESLRGLLPLHWRRASPTAS